MIIAPYTSVGGTQLYTGVRGGVSVPIVQNAQVVTEAVSVPVGVSFRSGADVRVLLETGGAFAGTQSHSNDAMLNGATTYFGVYGAMGVLVIVR